MFNYESARFWINIFLGNATIAMCCSNYNSAYGAIREKKRKLNFFDMFVLGIMAVFLFDLWERTMDIPSIFSKNCQYTEGMVVEFDSYYDKMDLGGLSVTITEDGTGEKIKFMQTNNPSSLCKGDHVKIAYLNYTKTGTIININGISVNNHIDSNVFTKSVSIFYLMTWAMFYYFKNFKLEAILRYEQDYSVHVYHNKFVKAIWGVYLIRVVTACVLILAIMGHYKNSFDCFWGILIILNYLGVFGLCFMNSKKFIIMRKRFYYADAHNRYEGDLEEIESVRETEDGLAITANGTEMKILCTAKKEQEKLCGKLHMKREVLA